MRRAALFLVCASILAGCGGTTPAADPLRATLTGMHGSSFSSVSLKDGVLSLRPTQRRGRHYLFRAQWEAYLMAAAVAERQRAAGDATLRFLRFAGGKHAYLQNHEVSPRGFTGPRYRGAHLKPPGLWQDSDLMIEQRVRHALTALGLTSVRVQVLRPLGPAVAIRAVATRATHHFNVDDLTPTACDPEWDGCLVRIDSRRGRTLLEWQISHRLHIGGGASAPGQDRFGMTHA